MKLKFALMIALTMIATPYANAQAQQSGDANMAMTFDAALAEKGKKVFKKCAACHKVGDNAKNGVGPIMHNIIGKPAAKNETFKYSKAMIKASEEGLTWTEDNLREFFKKPRAFMKGTKMAFAGLKKDEELDAVIEYIKSLPK